MIIAAQNVITGDGNTVLKNSALLLREGHIATIGQPSELRRAHPTEEYLDFGAASILPGLIDMHIHLAYYDGRADEKLYTPHMLAYLALDIAQRQLRGGVTTLRDAYSPDAVVRQLALAAQKGWVRVPRLINSNQALTISGGIDWQMDGTVQVDGPEEIRKAVREQIRAGAQWIKAMTSYRTPGVAEFSQAELNAIVREAHHLGKKAMAHASLQPAIGMCIEAGFDTIEHGTDLTPAQAQLMLKKGQAWVPTIYVHKAFYERLQQKMGAEADQSKLTPRERQTYSIYGAALASYKRNLKNMHNSGLLIAAGTDCPFDGMEDITVAWELACMVEYGLTPLEAIATATSQAARVLGLNREIGELRPGAVADITVAAGNASQNIEALQQIREVFQAGLPLKLHDYRQRTYSLTRQRRIMSRRCMPYEFSHIHSFFRNRRGSSHSRRPR